MTDTVTVEAVQQTLAEYERLAIGTGEWNGTEAPEFSNGLKVASPLSIVPDGLDWTEAWQPTEEHPTPVYARATVWRKGVKKPAIVYVRWDEAVPAIEEWRELWLRKPVALFGAFTLRAAYRRAFRDVIGDRHEPDEAVGPVLTAPDEAAARDWFAELAAATTVEQVSELHKAAKRARIVTVQLDTEFRRRFRDLGAGHLTPPEPARQRPIPTPPTVRPEDTVRKPRRQKGK